MHITYKHVFVLVLFLFFSCESEQNYSVKDIVQVSVEKEIQGEITMKYFSMNNSFEYIPTTGKVDSVSLSSSDWNKLITKIDSYNILNKDVDKGSWENFPKKITLYLSFKEKLIKKSVTHTNESMYLKFNSLFELF